MKITDNFDNKKDKKTFVYIRYITVFVLFLFFILICIIGESETKQVKVTFYTDIKNNDTAEYIGQTGDLFPNIEAPSKDGHEFTGWIDADGDIYKLTKFPKESIDLYASWDVLPNSIYNANSSLPKVNIDIANSIPLPSITREEYVYSTFTISNTDEEYEKDNIFASIKGRGNGSWESGPKKGYAIKFYEPESLFGQAKAEDWVLLSGSNYYDPTLLINSSAFRLANSVFDNIEYASSTNFVDLYVNNEYRGVYLLAEKVEVAESKIDIESEYKVNDTGYLIEYDGYAEGYEGYGGGIENIDYFKVDGYRYGFSIKSPDPRGWIGSNVTEAEFRSQVDFISAYTSNTLRAALKSAKDPTAYETFKANADVESFVDMYILHELFKNTDTGWSSFYMYKKPGGKLYAAPPWDFDLSTIRSRGDNTYEGIYVSQQIQEYSSFTASQLYISLMKNEDFKNTVIKRWMNISDDLKSEIELLFSDDYIYKNTVAFSRNFYYWSFVYKSYEYTSDFDQSQITWKNNVYYLRDWLLNRIAWLDSEWTF